jgi:hypothetical protein
LRAGFVFHEQRRWISGSKRVGLDEAHEVTFELRESAKVCFN